MKRTPRTFLWLAVAAAASLIAAASAQSSAPVPSPRTVWDGVYTDAQAKDGETLFSSICADCHGDDLAGVEQAPALAGSSFTEKWNRATLRKLYETMEQMPPKKPKSLTAKQYTDLLAYLLSANEFPAGKAALEVDRTVLGGITLTSARPQP